LDAGLNRVQQALVADINNELGKGRIGLLRGIGQQEAQGAAAHHRGQVGDARHSTDELGHLRGGAIELIGSRPLGQPDIHQQLPSGGIRKEALLDEAKAKARQNQQADEHPQGEPAKFEAKEQQTLVGGVKNSRVRIAAPCLGPLSALLQKEISQKGGGGHSGNPADGQRNQEHDKERAAIFPGAILGEPDGAKSEDGDGR
jgi:hypothetical protein